MAPALNIDEILFSRLAQVTHETYAGIIPQTPPAVIVRIPGDANGDGCVDTLDHSLVLQHVGTMGNGNDDFNRDGVVSTMICRPCSSISEKAVPPARGM
jgi:hypothetical protein